MKHSVDLYNRLEAETGQAVGVHQPGSLTFTRNSDWVYEFKRQVAAGKILGLEFEVMGPDEMKAKVPLMNTDGLAAGVWDPLHGHFDPSSTTQAMAAGARALGATIRQQSWVSGLEHLPAVAGVSISRITSR